MARKPRLCVPGVPQHVIQRGNDRKPCFFAEGDCRVYLDYLAEAAERYACRLHAYVLMTNHVHLLVTPTGEHGIAHMMQRLGQRYVQSLNAVYRRSGTLWEGRYKASLVDSEHYLLTCMRYIELNPVRAGMVVHPAEYRWSSYRANAQGEVNRLLAQHDLYHRLGASAEARCAAYRALFSACPGAAVVDEIRGALNQELVLGSSGFR
jgi:putative transposase